MNKLVKLLSFTKKNILYLPESSYIKLNILNSDSNISLKIEDTSSFNDIHHKLNNIGEYEFWIIDSKFNLIKQIAWSYLPLTIHKKIYLYRNYTLIYLCNSKEYIISF